MNKIAKRCYEKRYGTQKYKDSALYGTFEPVIENIIIEAKKEVFRDIEKAVKDNADAPFIMWVEDFHSKKKKMCITAVSDYWKLKKRHLSILQK